MKKNVKYTKVKKDKLLEEKTDELVSKLSKFLKVRNEDAFSCDVEFAKTTNHHKHGEIYKVEYAGRKSNSIFSFAAQVCTNAQR